MIPILFDKTETSFASNGLGRLGDCPRCIVTEERNGVYECEFDYPVTGVRFDDIQIGRIVTVTHDESGNIQPFDIYRKTEPIDGIVTFYAQHVSYRTNGVTIKPFTASSCADTFLKIPANSIGENPFTFWTNKSVSSDFEVSEPRNLRGLLAGEEGSILDVYGTGEYEFDKFDIKLYLHRGQDTEVSIRYGKNLVDIENDVDAGDIYTAVVPFWAGDNDGAVVLVTLPEWYISSGYLSPGGREVIIPMDLSDAFEEQPAVEQLRTKAQSRLANSSAWLPNQNIKVDFVQLWQTEEYKQFAPLQRLKLCDTCEIVVPMYDLDFRAKVIRTVWNVLSERYDEMELGDKPSTYADVLVKPVEEAVAKAIGDTKTVIDAALANGIADAMEQIRGGMGGYIVQTVNTAGQPIELLVTDNLDLTQAVNIWRWNLGGLAHSSNGYNGPYDVAITQDGKINASMILTGALTANLITTGTLSADRIAAHSIGTAKLSGSMQGGLSNSWKIDFDNGTLTIGNISASNITTGTLTLGGVNNTNGQLVIKDASNNTIGQWNNAGISMSKGSITDASGKNSWDLSSGQFSTKQGTIGGFTINDTMLYSSNAQLSPSGILYFGADSSYPTYTLFHELTNLGLSGIYVDTNNNSGSMYGISCQKTSDGYMLIIHGGEDGGGRLLLEGYESSATYKARLQGGVQADTLNVSGAASVAGNLTASGNVSVSGNLTVSGSYPKGSVVTLSGAVTSSVTISNYTNYSALICVARPSGGSLTSTFIPISAIGADRWEVADNEDTGYVNFNFSTSGTTLTVTMNHGSLVGIYGLKF